MKSLKWLLPYILKYKKKIIAGIIFITISNLASAYSPRLVGETIDIIKSGEFNQVVVNQKIAFILLLTLVSGFFLFLTRQTIIHSSRLIEYDLRKELMEKLMHQPIEFFHRNDSGNIMAYATNDIPSAREFLGPVIMYSTNAITTFVFVLYFMLNIDLTLTLVAFSPLPLITYATYKIGNRVHKASYEVQNKYAELTRQAQEFVSGIRIIRAYNATSNERAYFEKLSNDYYRKNLHLARLQSLFMPVMIILVGLSFVSVLAYGGYEVINNRITLGTITQFFIYLTMLIWPVAAIGYITNLVQRASASVHRLENLFKSFGYEDENKKFDHKKIEKGEIVVRDLSFKYISDYILENINLHIKPKSTIGIIGSIGSGKTTLLNLLVGIYKNFEGEILIDGIDLRNFSLKQLRENISYVPQDVFLFSTTIKENICFGNPNAEDEEINQAAKIAGIFDEIISFPNGFETIVGERGITLSGGQKQRIAIARAILKKSKILLIDDALSAVDAAKEKEIINNLRNVIEKQTTLIVSHRLSVVKDCDIIIVLENGKVIESGTHNELIDRQGYYYHTYQKQMLEEEIEQL